MNIIFRMIHPEYSERLVIRLFSKGLNLAKYTLGLFLFCILLSNKSSAQITMSDGTSTTCSDLFYDSGGDGSEYSDNEDYTHTIYPATPGAPVKVDFTSFMLEPCCDYLSIYDGNSTSAPLIGTYASSSPGTIISTAADGSLTFVFHSDVSVTEFGWEATVSCVTPCIGMPTAGTAIASTTTACPGVPVLFSLSGATTGTGLTYAWDTSATGTGGWGAITGATDKILSFVPPIGRTLYYRCTITCTSSASSATSTSVSVSAGLPLVPPYTENFEAATVGVNVPCASYTGGWSNGQWWYIRNRSYCSLTNHTPGGTKYLLGGYYLEIGSGNREYWFTPGFNLLPGKTYRFSYWYLGDGSGSSGAGTGAYIGTAQTRAAMAPIGPFIATTTTTFTQYVTDFTVPSDAIYYIGVRVKSTYSCGFAIDDLNLIELPLCNTATATSFASGGKASVTPGVVCSVPGTTNLNVTGTPPFSGLDFSWERSTVPNFSSFTTVATTAAATNSVTSAGPFYYRCKVTCAATGTFVYSDTIQLNTAPITPPYIETFETVTPGDNAPCASATSWSPWGDYFNTESTPTMTWGYTDLENHTAGGTNYLLGGYGLSVYTGYSKDFWFSPGIDLTAGNTYEFSYWYLPDNAPNPTVLGAYVGTSQDDWAMTPLIPDFYPSNSVYKQVTASYAPASSGVYYFGIYVQGSRAYGVAIDDIGVNQLPPCAGKPSSGGIASVSPTMLCSPGSATFSLSGAPRVANLSYEWWECDAAGNLISMVSPADVSPVFVSGTISSSSYFRCIVACTLGSATDTTYSSVIKIDAGAITPPYIETFETGMPGTNMPCASYTYDFGADWVWNLKSSPYSSWAGASLDNHTKGGTKYLLGGSDLGLWTGSPEYWFTPAIKFTAGNLYQLSFWYQTDGEPGTTYNIAAFMGAGQSGADMTTAIGTPISTTTKVYKEFKEQFTASASGDFYIGIQKDQTNWGNGIAIDDIGLQEVPACSDPVVAGTIIAEPFHVCAPGGTTLLNLEGSTLATGLTYQWLSSTSKTGPFVATTGTSLPYTTDPLPVTTWFKAVVKCTASGISDTTEIFKVGVGAMDLPYSEDFESTASGEVPLCSDATLWGDYYYEGWYVCSNGKIGGPYKSNTPGGKNFLVGGYQLGSPDFPSEDNYWFTPGLNLRSGYNYNLSFYYLASYSGDESKMGVYIGKSQSVGAMTTPVAAYRVISNSTYQLLDTQFKVSTDGVYYLGFRKSANNPASSYSFEGVAFDDINLNYGPCDGMPAAGRIEGRLPSGTQYCRGSQITLTDIGSTISLVPGIKFQWMRQSFSSPVWNTIVGANDTVLSADTLVGFNYRLAVICSNTNDTVYTAPFSVPQYPDHPPVSISPASTPATFCLGDTVRFNATNFSGATYDWMLDSVVIPGWKFSDLGAVDPGTYMVRVSSALSPCPAYSNQVVLNANDPGYTVEIAKPADSIICAGTSLKLTGSASKPGVTYQWRRDNVNIPGATTNSLFVYTSGYYRLVASDGSSTCPAVSRNILITVKPNPPAVISVPGGTTTACAEDGVLLNANVGGYSYQWSRAGAPIVGWTDSSQRIKTSGTYQVQVRSSDGCVSYSAPVTVNILPAPTPSIYKTGLVLGVVTPPPYTSYQWIRNGVVMSPARTSDTLRLTLKGLYKVRVTDLNNCEGESTPIEVMDEGLSIGELPSQEDQIHIYPNPTNAKVSIESPISLNIEVKDMTGKTIINLQDAKEVDLGKYADGVYLLILRNHDQMIKQQRVTKTSR